MVKKMSKQIEIPVAYKRPSTELTDSVKFVIAVDRSHIEQIVRWSAVDFKTPLKVTIEEIEDPTQPPSYDFSQLDEETKKRRKKKYDTVLVLAHELGWTEAYRKETQREVLGKESMTEMSEDELDELIKYLQSERAFLPAEEK